MSDDDIAGMSYEQALAELDALIGRLEGGAVDLDEAVGCYERGSRLAQRCAELLDRTEARVMQLVVGPGGVLQERPFSPEVETPPETAPQRTTAEPSARPAATPLGPPPPTSPLRARAAPAPGLFPGLDPPSRQDDAPPPDLDDIPF